MLPADWMPFFSTSPICYLSHDEVSNGSSEVNPMGMNGVDHSNGLNTKKAFYWHVVLRPTPLKRFSTHTVPYMLTCVCRTFSEQNSIAHREKKISIKNTMIRALLHKYCSTLKTISSLMTSNGKNQGLNLSRYIYTKLLLLNFISSTVILYVIHDFFFVLAE